MKSGHVVWTLFFLSCTTLAPIQQNQPRRPYPADRYIVGSGTGATVEIARQRALVAISSQLQGSIRAEGTILAEAERTEGVGVDPGRNYDREQVREVIHVETHLARIEWIQVVSAEEKDDGIEVLAVLDRQDAAGKLRDEIRTSLEGLRGRISRARASERMLSAARALAGLQAEKRGIVSSLELLATLSSTRISHPEEVREIDRLSEELGDKWSALRWRVCLQGQHAASPVEARIAGGFASRGFRTAPCAPDQEAEAEQDAEAGSTWRLHGEFGEKVQRMRQAGGYPYFCTTNLSFRIEGGDGVLEGGGVAQGLRAGGMSAKDACASSLEHLVVRLLEAVGVPR